MSIKVVHMSYREWHRDHQQIVSLALGTTHKRLYAKTNMAHLLHVCRNKHVHCQPTATTTGIFVAVVAVVVAMVWVSANADDVALTRPLGTQPALARDLGLFTISTSYLKANSCALCFSYASEAGLAIWSCKRSNKIGPGASAAAADSILLQITPFGISCSLSGTFSGAFGEAFCVDDANNLASSSCKSCCSN